MSGARDASEMTCREVAGHVSAYLDGALSPDQAIELSSHLRTCDGCALYVKQFRQTIAATQTLGHEPIASHLRERLMDAFGGWKQDAGLARGA